MAPQERAGGDAVKPGRWGRAKKAFPKFARVGSCRSGWNRRRVTIASNRQRNIQKGERRWTARRKGKRKKTKGSC